MSVVAGSYVSGNQQAGSMCTVSMQKRTYSGQVAAAGTKKEMEKLEQDFLDGSYTPFECQSPVCVPPSPKADSPASPTPDSSSLASQATDLLLPPVVSLTTKSKHPSLHVKRKTEDEKEVNLGKSFRNEVKKRKTCSEHTITKSKRELPKEITMINDKLKCASKKGRTDQKILAIAKHGGSRPQDKLNNQPPASNSAPDIPSDKLVHQPTSTSLETKPQDGLDNYQLCLSPARPKNNLGLGFTQPSRLTLSPQTPVSQRIGVPPAFHFSPTISISEYDSTPSPPPFIQSLQTSGTARNLSDEISECMTGQQLSVAVKDLGVMMERIEDGQNEILGTLKRLEKTVAKYLHTPEDHLHSVHSNMPQSISPVNTEHNVHNVHVNSPTNSCNTTVDNSPINPVLKTPTKHPEPLPLQHTYLNVPLSADAIPREKLLSIQGTLMRCKELKTPEKASTLTQKLAKEAIFGIEVMKQCTPGGSRELPALPKKEIFTLKKTIYKQLPQLWHSPIAFEKLWKSKCWPAVEQACRRLRRRDQ